MHSNRQGRGGGAAGGGRGSVFSRLGSAPQRDDYNNYQDNTQQQGNYQRGGNNFRQGGGNYQQGDGQFGQDDGNYHQNRGGFQQGGGNYQRGRGNYQRGGGNYRGGGNPQDRGYHQRDSGNQQQYNDASPRPFRQQRGRSTYTRQLDDGDMEMETAPITSGNSPGVVVTGYPPNSVNNLLGFLKRKAKPPVQILDHREENGSLLISVPDEAAVKTLCRLNGYEFSRERISVQPAQGAPRMGSAPVSNTLREFLQERWDAQQGFLNLEALPKTKHSIGTAISRLLQAAHDLWGNQVMTISFASNGLWTLKPVISLKSFFPGIRNLSFQNNDIDKFRGLDDLSSAFPQLNELLFVGNPIQQNTPWAQYQSEVMQRFPTITMLDQQPVGNPALQPQPIGNAPQPGIIGLPTKPDFFDQNGSREATQALLSKYFPLFDSNRLALVDLYDPNAIFSFNVNPASPARNTWGQGLPQQRRAMGQENIIKRLTTLPPTIHDLSRSENFRTDAWQTPGSQTHPICLFITVHGEFREASGAAGSRYSFDRVFLVAPSVPGSRANIAGWHVVILSDSLIVRDYSGPAGAPTL